MTDFRRLPGALLVLWFILVPRGTPGADCPGSGDTHCNDLAVEMDVGWSTSSVLLKAMATDDSGDPVLYSFAVMSGSIPLKETGPQTENTAAFEVPSGSWTMTATVDDDLDCEDAAADSVCSVQVFIPHVDFPMHARGDADGNTQIDITDAVQILVFLFLGLPTWCLASDDVNADGAVDISDAMYLLNYLFLGASSPQPPGLPCGFAPQESDYNLGCVNRAGC